MTILTQLHVIRLLVLGMLLILPATSGAQQRPPILEKLTKTYGLESFGQIEAIRYTGEKGFPPPIDPSPDAAYLPHGHSWASSNERRF